MSKPSLAPNEPAKPRLGFAAQLLHSRETGIVGALVIMIVVLSIFAPDFASKGNLLNDARNLSFIGIVVLGQAAVMITGGIDLSVGSVWELAAVASAAMMQAGMGVFPACVLTLLICAVVGLFNGFCVTKLRMLPFVPTLATMSIARARALIITRGKAIDGFRPDGDAFFALGGGDIFDLPVPFVIFVVLAIIAAIVLKRTVFGRQLYAVGGNERAAVLTGLNVDRLKMSVYVMSSVLAGLAGIIEVSYLSSAISNQGLGKELSVIGGTALSGGEGTIISVFVGTVILEVLRNGLVLLGTDAYWQGVFVGSVIVLAMFIDQLRKGVWRRR
ncbi:Ribose ABC transport system, permease protein RbsC [Candidatus Burkholderia verschuerenii]|uniref:Ribose ABC transport system, permease protein RbsC n=1 Tax=Candidatus Burkholderia verschuerenii TaxID=242163 RepID=A0A0L0MDZ2_9BURK|nr:ABC transporter permease [Candidatus Burkholderia verschuerenii]KND60495.1 Ribose ABC transport system, permease protein RbsC [Candidatus Burkholderia verschuerenii]